MSDKKGAGWGKLGLWNKRMAILETLAHLEAMRAREKLDKFTKDDIIYYSIPRSPKANEPAR